MTNSTPENDGTAATPTVDPTSPSVYAYIAVGNSIAKMNRALPRRVLGVWAHPDDEAYLSAGLMARVIGDGGEVTVLTATRGEKGTDDPRCYDSDAFGDVRECELRGALGALGVDDVRFMGLRDGECDVSDDEGAVSQIASAIASVRPDALLTFGPDGITNHPDHRSVSRWTTEAWRRVGCGELFYATMTHDFVARHRALHDEIGVFNDFGDGRPRSVERSLIALECALTDHELDRKRASLSHHASQIPGLVALLGEDVYRTWWREEHFRTPTSSEIAGCILPAWIQDGSENERRLAGSSS